MSVSPSPVPASPSAVPGAPPAPPKPAAAPLPPRTGQVIDRGTVRRESIHAETWAIDGTAKVLGNVDVGQADLRGFVTIVGALSADRVLARGELEVVGIVTTRGTLEVRGQCRTFTDVDATDAGFDGTVHIGGALRVTRLLQIRGQLAVVGSASAGFFQADGRFEIRGTLRAPRVQATIRGVSHIGTVEGGDVRFTLPVRPPILRSILESPTLDIDRIEAETVHIEGVTVQYLRADRIVVGRNCHVVRYDGTIDSCHPSSHLGPESRSPHPPGMSR
ncbi:MAG TPA: hypothetical protein VMV28_02715 [Thermoplasmata archaeon]|nr:hypothetical protein [Thermoplasmata archaeon]